MVLKNTTVYNKDTVHEMIGKISKPVYMYFGGISAAAIAAALVFSLINFWSYGVYVAVVAVVVTGMSVYEMITRPKAIEKSMIKGIKSRHNADSYETLYEISEKSIAGTTDISHTDYKNSDIKRIEETENLFVITYTGKTYGVIAKKGFTVGTAEDFRKMFGSLIK